ncbi:MAG: LLM class F420-dependent oxidoreductase [Rhodospirillaceae bacterium]|jgi:probable F420-dependent oxidoreductase|nr:LLM class F420-dependent oxidoreductase [Rhodospirillaceae bacterium]MBT3493316.1 LLM class F420-dependent oxidoreductase [Rhodospirillaceae bacterium]MBT3780594.1 LLM class F420-dependent oxidoreductase [Rhodospirillaceae bacterium]MBT3976287.1 LLM class F420-dependent oxidoreductase [Rhodospirillaceae bacterium]MBT4169599.1 LLM class F420-dependent oxidoreductase [Rhodospirillaceae bacterium]
MKAGFGIPNNQGVEDPNDLVALAVTAERLGFASVWVREHLFHSTYVAERLGDKPYHDALTVLTAIACATKTVRLGTSVLVLPWHDPARLGKMVATLDQLSGGRVDLGVGVAVTRDEFENLGVDFATRGKRTDEILGALQALWTQDTPEFAGEYYRYSGLKFSPKPLQAPYPPLLIGGSSAAAKRRVVRFGDGWHTLRQSPSQFAEGRQDIIKEMEAAGRDPADLQFSLTLPVRFTGKAPSAPVQDRTALTGTDDDIVETIKAYEAAGLDEIVVGVSSADVAENTDAMEHFMQRVWSKL